MHDQILLHNKYNKYDLIIWWYTQSYIIVPPLLSRSPFSKVFEGFIPPVWGIYLLNMFVFFNSFIQKWRKEDISNATRWHNYTLQREKYRGQSRIILKHKKKLVFTSRNTGILSGNLDIREYERQPQRLCYKESERMNNEVKKKLGNKFIDAGAYKQIKR